MEEPFTTFFEDRVVLVPVKEFLPSVISKFHLGRELVLPRMPTQGEGTPNPLDAGATVQTYVDATLPIRKSDRLFIIPAGPKKGKAAASRTIAAWLVKVIRMAYLEKGLQPPARIRAHSTRVRDKDTKTRVEGPPVRRDIPAPGVVQKKKSKSPSSGMFGQAVAQSLVYEAESLSVPSVETPALLKLISLQNADGSWKLNPQFSAILGISEENIKAGSPDQSVDVSVWVTVLAVIWLHVTSLDQRDEWELLEGKAVSWLRAKAGPSLGELVRAGNGLLKSSVNPKVFGL
ncbi:uncharacterized protein ACMZJ9_008865 [Mantella aurantiaca]